MSGCAVDDCDRDHYGLGWCKTHYVRWRRHGDPMPDKPIRKRRGPRPPTPAPQRTRVKPWRFV